ncbi:cyclin-dependent kinase 9-like [Watersipora subatra]|uniref:cyclin-dependent kinase 9-like n=1 Tax=Watersipora subatra TaxID=2589382 RepID=UPI00355B42E0
MSKGDRGEKQEELEFPYCRDAARYTKETKVGQGTFGEVFKARCRETGEVVALKKILMENEREGFPITALREIRILQLLVNENVVRLIEICRTKANSYNRYKSTFFLVFEFCDHDLAGLLSNPNVKFGLKEQKEVMKQLCSGLFFIHGNKILHRDMKAANILITKKGVLKLADFGLSRAFCASNTTEPRYTNRVVTLWYRPPELLLGSRSYGPPIDMWGAGCIMAELWTRAPIMQGDTETKQLMLICQLCGSINNEVWPNVEDMDLYKTLELPKDAKRRVKERLRHYVKDSYALDLLDKLLTLNPARRFSADDALDHAFFWEDPMPSREAFAKMLSLHSTSMFEFLAPRRPHGHHPNHHHQSRAQTSQAAAAHSSGAPTQQKPGQHFDRVF